LDVVRLIRLDRVRAVNVVGPPGVGKRRFTADVASVLRSDERVVLVRLRLLSPAGEGVRIHPAIRDVALGA
jgi:KaiC/GvpD/RAD55 family RecA-like ATPase